MDVGQDRHNIKGRFILRERWPKPEYGLNSLGDKRMLPHGDTVDPNMELGDRGSVKVHSAPFSTCLIQVSYVFDHNGRSTSGRNSLELLTKESESPKGVSVSRCSLGSKMVRKKVQISLIQIMISST